MQTRHLRVAYFAGSMRPGHDGVTTVLYRLIPFLQEHEVLNVFFSPLVPYPADRPTTMMRVPSVAFPLYKDYRFALPTQRPFEEQLRRFDPDLIHINSPCSLGYAATQFGRRFHIPVVATYHTHFPSYAKYYNVRVLEDASWMYLRRLYGRCQRVFVPSQPILHELASQGIGNLEYLPHGVDTTRFHPQFRSVSWRSRHGITQRYVLLYAGRLVWEKDLATLAAAYRLLRLKRHDIALVLAGDGPIRRELSALLPDARFLGHLSGSALSETFASSDMLIFPSTTETFGNVILEAMASGIVPICAREGGAHGVVQNGVTGRLVQPRNPHDLAATIDALLDNPSKRAALADQGLAFARQQTWDRIFARMIESYWEVLGARKVLIHKQSREAA